MLDDSQANDDAFDVAVEDAITDRPSKRSKAGSSTSKPKMPRKGRDAKFGFGGTKRRSKQNTRESTEKFDFGVRSKGVGGKAGKGGKGSSKPKRLGKSRRMATRGR